MEMVTPAQPAEGKQRAPRTWAARLRASHRWLGLIFGLSVLLSASSGVVHTVMTWTQAPPPRPGPGALPLNLELVKLTPAEASKKAENAKYGKTLGINLRMIQNQPWYIVQTGGAEPARLYINATNGEISMTADVGFAEEIASRHLGGAKVELVSRLNSYDSEYIAIFRILPVYKFTLNDRAGTRVYVSTLTESVTRHTDNAKQWEADLFSNAHKLAFIPSKTVRDGILVTMTGGIAMAALAGIALFFARR